MTTVRGRPRTLLERQLAGAAKRARMLARSRQREIAGVLVERDRLLQLVELRNVSRARGSFEIRRKDIRVVDGAARRLGARVVGTYHSHVATEAHPGPRDIREATDGWLMLIYDTIGEEWRLWRIRNRRSYPLRFRTV